MSVTYLDPHEFPQPDLPEDDLGPAMLALSPHQRRFVAAYVSGLYKTQQDSAAAAGYSTTGEGHKVWASRMLRSTKIIAAIREVGGLTFQEFAVRAMHRLAKNLESDDPRVSQAAADSILDRAGYGRRTEHAVSVDRVDKRSTEELLAEVAKYLPDKRVVPMIEVVPAKVVVDDEG